MYLYAQLFAYCNLPPNLVASAVFSRAQFQKSKTGKSGNTCSCYNLIAVLNYYRQYYISNGKKSLMVNWGHEIKFILIERGG